MPKMKMLSLPISSAISTFAPSRVPIVNAPFNCENRTKNEAEKPSGKSRTIERSCPTYHEFHVARARGLGTSGRDLLAEIGRRDDLLGQRHPVVLEENELELVADNRIVVDDIGDAADELDDLLGEVVARGGLAADHHGARHHRGIRVLLDAIEERDDVEAVEQLALVLVDALDLDVEDRAGIDLDAVVALENLRQSHLVLLLDFDDGALERRVLGKLLQLRELLQVYRPVASDFLPISHNLIRRSDFLL